METTNQLGRVGGLSVMKVADETVKQVVRDVEPEVTKELGKAVEDSDVISYKTQVVSGVVYFVKVKTGDTEYANLKIYKNFSNESTLKGVQKGKTAEDEITYF